MSDAKRLIIHLGVHKTGSTAIQHYLWRHADSLPQYGIYYPATGRPTSEVTHFGHHEIPWSFTPRGVEKPETVLERLRREVELTTVDNVILSSEEFDRIDLDTIRIIAAALPFPTTVIFYYRRQSEIAQGLYGTDVTFIGERRDIAQYAESLRDMLDFHALAGRWASVYGREAIIARPYDRKSFPQQNIVPAFLETLGLQAAPTADGELCEYNRSLPWFATLSVLRLRRLHVADSVINAIVNALEPVFRDHRERQLGLLSPSSARAFDLSFFDSNDAFIRDFAPGQPPIVPHSGDGDEAFLDERMGLWPEVERTLEAVANYVRLADEFGFRPQTDGNS